MHLTCIDTCMVFVTGSRNGFRSHWSPPYIPNYLASAYYTISGNTEPLAHGLAHAGSQVVPTGSHSGDLGNSCSQTHSEISETTPAGTMAQQWPKMYYVIKAIEILDFCNMVQSLVQVTPGHWLPPHTCNHPANGYFTTSGHPEPLAHGGSHDCSRWLTFREP